jgi:hypothetical protein
VFHLSLQFHLDHPVHCITADCRKCSVCDAAVPYVMRHTVSLVTKEQDATATNPKCQCQGSCVGKVQCTDISSWSFNCMKISTSSMTWSQNTKTLSRAYETWRLDSRSGSDMDTGIMYGGERRTTVKRRQFETHRTTLYGWQYRNACMISTSRPKSKFWSSSVFTCLKMKVLAI